MNKITINENILTKNQNTILQTALEALLSDYQSKNLSTVEIEKLLSLMQVNQMPVNNMRTPEERAAIHQKIIEFAIKMEKYGTVYSRMSHEELTRPRHIESQPKVHNPKPFDMDRIYGFDERGTPQVDMNRVYGFEEK